MLSFLVKQGRASLAPRKDGGGIPHEKVKVELAKPPSAGEYADEGLTNTQFCMRLDYGHWRALSQRLEPDRDVLARFRPPRCTDARLASLGRGARLAQPHASSGGPHLDAPP